MTKGQSTGDGWTQTMRWTARILALVAVALFGLFLAQSGASRLPALSWTSPQGLPLLVVLIAALVGVLIGWRWELVGGILTMVAAAAIIAQTCLGSGTDMFLCSLFFTLPLLVSGVLYLGCCWRTRTVAVAG